MPQASNYNQRSRIEKFHDKKDSLRTAKLAQMVDLSNQFSDHRVAGPATYEQAKRDIESGDWEKEVKGLEVIASIAKDMPEVKHKQLAADERATHCCSL